MLNVQALINSLKQSIIQGWGMWLVTLVISFIALWGIQGLLYAFGKDHLLTPERKKFFYGIGSVFLFIALLFAQYITSLLQDISAASPRKGGFRAGFLSIQGIKGVKIVDPTTNNAPSIPFTMSGVGGLSKAKPGGVDMLFVVKVDNSGQPSVAWNWKTYIELPGGTKIEGQIPGTSFPSNTIIQTVVGPVSATAQNYLVQSLSVNPLPTGAGFIGWMLVHFNDIGDVPIGSRIVLSFEDVNSRETKTEYIWVEPK